MRRGSRYVNDAECAAAGLDPQEVGKIAVGLSRYACAAQKLGLTIFGGGSGTLRFDDGSGKALIVADLDGYFDGGDGATREDADGLLRGEGEEG
jgi:hypothetical protein